MAAGLGFKTFTTGEVLTAADTNGYLMQGILVFASAAARDAAITSPQEGQFAYLKDTNVTTYYTGSAWANVDTTGMTNPMTTTGDSIYSSSGSTPARLGIGSTGQVLTVASGIPSWATPTSGGMTLINSGGTTLTGASVTISSIPATYKELYIYIENAVPATNDVQFNMRFNSDTSSIYNSIRSVDTTISKTGADKLGISFNISNTSSNGIGIVRIPNYFSTTAPKSYFSHSQFTYHPTTTQWLVSMITGIYNSTSAISSITLFPSSGNWTSGTAYVYGVS